MSSYLPCDVSATAVPDACPRWAGSLAAGPLAVPCWPGVIAVGAGDLADPSDGRQDGALVAAARAGRVSPGQVMTLAVPVVTVPVKVRRSGAVQADGWLPDQVRLGMLEAVLGDGVIEELCDAAVAAGLVRPPERRRLMSLPFIMRVVVAMTLLPDADYPEVIRVLTGLLPRLPWARRWQVPAHKTVTRWRRRLGAWPLEQLFWRVAGPLVPDGAPGSVMIAGRPLCSMDGFELDVPATGKNLAVFSCTGVSKDTRWQGQGGKGQLKTGQAGKAVPEGSFPHLRCLLITARAGRAVMGAAVDTTDAGEQSLVARLVREHPELFAGRVFLMDRNFLGYHLITAILDAGGHLIMRVRSGISLPVTAGGWLPDGSRLTYLDEPGRHRVADRLPLRAAEHNVVLPGSDGDVSETYTIATTLLDHRDAGAEVLRAAYPMRWSASETTIGENKTTVTGAGPATTPCLRSGEPELIYQEFWAWLTATQLVRASASAAAGTRTAAAITARRGQDHPAVTDQVSFTTMRRAATASMRQSLVTATTSLAALAAHAEDAARTALHTLNTTGRQRYSERKQKSRPAFGHTPVTKATHRGPVKITRFQPATDGGT
ncbi:MAG: transposase domain-containing protein [Streptosporangiaceae bacterium]